MTKLSHYISIRKDSRCFATQVATCGNASVRENRLAGHCLSDASLSSYDVLTPKSVLLLLLTKKRR